MDLTTKINDFWDKVLLINLEIQKAINSQNFNFLVFWGRKVDPKCWIPNLIFKKCNKLWCLTLVISWKYTQIQHFFRARIPQNQLTVSKVKWKKVSFSFSRLPSFPSLPLPFSISIRVTAFVKHQCPPKKTLVAKPFKESVKKSIGCLFNVFRWSKDN